MRRVDCHLAADEEEVLKTNALLVDRLSLLLICSVRLNLEHKKTFNYLFHQIVHEQLTIDSLEPSSNVDLSMYLIGGIRFGT